MLTIPTTVKIFVCLQPIDSRRGFDALAEMMVLLNFQWVSIEQSRRVRLSEGTRFWPDEEGPSLT